MPITKMNLASALPSYQKADLQGRAVLMRVDFNIAPTHATEQNPFGLSDDHRLRAHLPGIQELLSKGARLVLLTHRGRPQGQIAPNLSTLPLANALSSMLGQQVNHVPDCIGRVAEQAIKQLEPGQAILLENTRFHMGETLNDHTFTRQLAGLGDIFINDAFATAHRAHASVTGLAARHPTSSYLGPLMLKELGWLKHLTTKPKSPFVAIIGGEDVAGKLELVQHLLTKVDVLMLAGGIAHTFLASRDYGLGQSMLDPASVAPARDVFTEAGVVGCRLLLPQDVQALPQRTPGAKQSSHRTTAITALQGNESAMDIGPATIATWQKVLAGAGTIVWLGALGACEHEPFHEGTIAIAKAVQASPAFSVIAGDALAHTLAVHNLRAGLPHISSGPAALHNALCGNPLPALQILKA